MFVIQLVFDLINLLQLFFIFLRNKKQANNYIQLNNLSIAFRSL